MKNRKISKYTSRTEEGLGVKAGAHYTQCTGGVWSGTAAKLHQAPLKQAQDTDHRQSTTKSNNIIKYINQSNIIKHTNQSHKCIVQKFGECGGIDPPESFYDSNTNSLIAPEAALILIRCQLGYWIIKTTSAH